MEAFEEGTSAEAIELLRAPGSRWLIAAVETSVSWPMTHQVIRHAGFAFVLRPRSEKSSAANILLNLRAHGLSDEQGLSRLFAFCSALSWAESESLVVRQWMYQNMPIGMGLGGGQVRAECLPWTELPTPTNASGEAALALFREALSSPNPFYASLTFYKVIEHLVPAKQRGAWMDSAWPRLKDERAINRHAHLVGEALNVGDYIRDNVRKAIAHTNFQPFVNPDDGADWNRITKDLPLMRELSMLCIQDKCTVPAPSSTQEADFGVLLSRQSNIEREYLLGKPLPQGQREHGTLFLPDPLTLVVRRGNYVESVPRLRVVRAELDDASRLVVWTVTLTGRHVVQFTIDFRAQEIECVGGVVRTVTESRDSLVEEIAIFSATCLHIRNGRIELWEGDTRCLVGKPYIPTNAFFNQKWAEAEAERLGQSLARIDSA